MPHKDAILEKKGSPLPVRLTECEKNQLTKIAQGTGLTSSTLIRLLISALVASYRKNNNTLSLPLAIEKILEDFCDH